MAAGRATQAGRHHHWNGRHQVGSELGPTAQWDGTVHAAGGPQASLAPGRTGMNTNERTYMN